MAEGALVLERLVVGLALLIAVKDQAVEPERDGQYEESATEKDRYEAHRIATPRWAYRPSAHTT